jgi:glycerol-3-phosphate dehydrogenase
MSVQTDVCALTVLKGVEFNHDKISLFTDQIEAALGCTCSALSGANIANESERRAMHVWQLTPPSCRRRLQ